MDLLEQMKVELCLLFAKPKADQARDKCCLVIHGHNNCAADGR